MKQFLLVSVLISIFLPLTVFGEEVPVSTFADFGNGAYLENKTFLIEDNIYLDDDLTIPSSSTLRFVRGGLIISNNHILTVNGGIEAGIFQIFENEQYTGYNDPNSYKFMLRDSKIDHVYPDWFISPSEEDESGAVQQAIHSCKKVILTKYYTISKTIYICYAATGYYIQNTHIIGANIYSTGFTATAQFEGHSLITNLNKDKSYVIPTGFPHFYLENFGINLCHGFKDPSFSLIFLNGEQGSYIRDLVIVNKLNSKDDPGPTPIIKSLIYANIGVGDIKNLDIGIGAIDLNAPAIVINSTTPPNSEGMGGTAGFLGSSWNVKIHQVNTWQPMIVLSSITAYAILEAIQLETSPGNGVPTVILKPTNNGFIHFRNSRIRANGGKNKTYNGIEIKASWYPVGNVYFDITDVQAVTYTGIAGGNQLFEPLLTINGKDGFHKEYNNAYFGKEPSGILKFNEIQQSFVMYGYENDIPVRSDLKISGLITANDIDATGAVTVDGNLIANKDLVTGISSRLIANGEVHINDNLHTATVSEINLNGTTNLNGPIFINGVEYVKKSITFKTDWNSSQTIEVLAKK